MLENICWYDKEYAPKQMVAGAKGELGFPPVELSEHFKDLIKLFNYIYDFEGYDKKFKLLDLGCGSASVSNHLLNNISYTGADLPHIIDEVAMKINSQNKYIKFDVYEDDLSFLSKYDIILCNAFVDIMEKPMLVLEKILKYAKNYIIIHRQRIGNKTKIEVQPSYGGTTYQSVLSSIELRELFSYHSFFNLKRIKVYSCGSDCESFLLKRV